MQDTHPLEPNSTEPVLLPFEEHEVDWGDGTVWFISRLDDCGGYYVERFYDDDFLDDPAMTTRCCPGPEVGVFATLEAIEAAMGDELPHRIRDALDVAWRPLDDDDRDAWGHVFAYQIHHLLGDGTIVTTWAPPWADDPLDPRWDLGAPT